jgi:ribosomal protein L29
MKAKNIREKSVSEIQSDLADARVELLNLKIKEAARNGGAAPVSVRELRRDIARMLTVLREREGQKEIAE